MSKIFYLVWSHEEPKHPQEIYLNSWNSGLSWYGQINPPNQSLDDWKKEQLEKHVSIMKEFLLHGKIRSMRWIRNPTHEEILSIEKDENFIEWCFTGEKKTIESR